MSGMAAAPRAGSADGVSVEEMAARYRAAVGPGTTDEFAIDALDRTGVGVWTAALWPSLENGVGYGPDRPTARRGAWAECVERVWSTATVPRLPVTRGSLTGLVATHGADGVLDPRRACLEAGTAWTPEAALHWIPMRREADGRPVRVPAELVASAPSELGRTPADGLVLPITNGAGAGDTRDRALAHALCELVQRDGNAVAFRALDRGVVVGLDEVSDRSTLALLERLDAEGVDVVAKLAADDLGIVSLYVVGADRDPERAPHPLAVTACGEAAHPDREVALRKALTELCAARVRKPFNHGPLEAFAPLTSPGYLERVRAEVPGRIAGAEPRALAATLDWLGRSAAELRDAMTPMLDFATQTVAFSTLPTTSVQTPGEVAEVVLARLADAGMGEVLVADLAPPAGGRGTGVAAVKVVVPGLECETGSYGRLGERGVRRLRRHPNPAVQGLVHVGEAPPGREAGHGAPRWERVALGASAEATVGGPAWLDRAGLDRLVDPLYALYREPGRHVAAFAAQQRAAGVGAAARGGAP